MKPISHDRALELVEGGMHAAIQRNKPFPMIQMREMREVLDRVGEVRVELRELREELDRMKRRQGALGSSDPD